MTDAQQDEPKPSPTSSSAGTGETGSKGCEGDSGLLARLREQIRAVDSRQPDGPVWCRHAVADDLDD